MLYQGKGGVCVHIRTIFTRNWFEIARSITEKPFFCQCMRSMISCDQVDPVIEQCFPECLSSLGCFDRRITFDLVAQTLIIIRTEMKMVHTYFSRYAFLCQWDHVSKKA